MEKTKIFFKKSWSYTKKVAGILTLIYSFISFFNPLEKSFFYIFMVIILISFLWGVLCTIFSNTKKIKTSNPAVTLKIRQTNDLLSERGCKIITTNIIGSTEVITDKSKKNGEINNKGKIPERTLYGQFLNNISEKKVKVRDEYLSIEDLKKALKRVSITPEEMTELLAEDKLKDYNGYGKGSFLDCDYLLTPLSSFNNKGPVVTLQSYVTYLINMWYEILSDRTVTKFIIPIVGTGFDTEKKNLSINPQEALEMMIWIFERTLEGIPDQKNIYKKEIEIVYLKSDSNRLDLKRL